MTATAVVELRSVSKHFGDVRAVDDVDLRIDAGELLAITGPSGSGKSTLLHLMGTLDRPSSGTLRICGQDLAQVDDRALSAVRATQIGFVFQQFHLHPGLTATDNVAMGLLYTGVATSERRRRAREALDAVGLSHRAEHLPNLMSGGERQRVAIARAVCATPEIVFADEPTGNLDSVSGAGIVTLLTELADRGTTVVVITHDRELAGQLPRQIQMRDGRVVADDRQRAA